jgi:hypothetical protein
MRSLQSLRILAPGFYRSFHFAFPATAQYTPIASARDPWLSTFAGVMKALGIKIRPIAAYGARFSDRMNSYLCIHVSQVSKSRPGAPGGWFIHLA